MKDASVRPIKDASVRSIKDSSSSSPPTGEAPDCWEELDAKVNTTALPSATNLGNEASPSPPTAVHIIRMDLDEHTPYRPQMRIMARKKNADNAGPEAVGEGSERRPPPELSLQERQRKYQEARLRIFGKDS